MESNESYQYSNRFYYFFKFESLKLYKRYIYNCISRGVIDKEKLFKTKLEEIQYPRTNATEIFINDKYIKDSVLLKIAAFGDWSESGNGALTLNYLLKNAKNYDHILLLGDQAYDLKNNFGERGNDYLESIQDITKTTPFMLSTGNHEFYGNYHDYIYRFYMPDKDSNKNLYYSFTINGIHFISITTDIIINNITEDSSNIYSSFINTFIQDKQRFIDWLINDLRNSKSIWKVVYMHRPVYCSSFNLHRCSDEAEILRNHLEPIFYEFGVDLVLSGHLHNYERMFPIFNNTVNTESITKSEQDVYVNPKYPVYVVCGTGGNVEGTTANCKINYI